MMSENKKPRTGRPTGATTKERVVVNAVTVRDPCPKCGSTAEPTNRRKLRQIEAAVKIAGHDCNSITQYNAVCADCKCAFMLREGTAT